MLKKKIHACLDLDLLTTGPSLLLSSLATKCVSQMDGLCTQSPPGHRGRMEAMSLHSETTPCFSVGWDSGKVWWRRDTTEPSVAIF